MKIRATIQMGAQTKKIVFVSQDNETAEHLALKVAAFILFMNENPVVEVGEKQSVLDDLGFKPDLCAFNEAGGIRLWVECGNVSTNKIEKLARRMNEGRIVVLKGLLREAQNLRRILDDNETRNRDHISIWAFPEGEFSSWFKAMDESVEVYGEWMEGEFNLVANATPFSFRFLKA